MGIKFSISLFNRNWHWTINRRLRVHHWDLRPWPNRLALFGFNPEFSDLVSQCSIDEVRDLGKVFEGASLILSENGKMYSQLCQEAFALAFTNCEKKPYYLEIGAFHPEQYSNTASLRKYMGWTGLSVDPSGDSREAFVAAGLEEHFLNMGVGVASGTAHFFSNGAFSQTLQEPSDYTSEIKIIGIRELVKLHTDISYVSLDIEGGEVDVIRAFPWEICKPRVFTIEHNYDEVVKRDLQYLMEDQGYRRVLDSVTNFESWFVLER